MSAMLPVLPQVMRVTECNQTVLKLMQVTTFVWEILGNCMDYLPEPYSQVA